MATVAKCNHSVLDLVTQLATMLEAEGLEPNVPTAAMVAKRRIKIYEALLLGGTMSTQEKLEMLEQVSDEVAKNPKQREMLHSIQNLLEGREEEVSQEQKQNEENLSKNRIRVLQPGVLQLHKTEELLLKECPKSLNSLDQMQRALKPLQLKPYSNLLMSRFKKETTPRWPRPKINPAYLKFSAIAESMSRMEDFNISPMNPPPRLPVIKKKSPPPEKPPPFVANPGPEKYFISDQMMTNELKLLQNKELELSYIEESIFIVHLKKAAAGLQSETILSSPKDELELVFRPNTTLRSVLPEVLEAFAHPFLRSGSAFRRLSARVRWNRNTKSRVERPLNRAMREVLADFLATSRQFLLTQTVDNLPQLLDNTRLAMQLLCQVEIMFKNEPRLNLDTGVSGSFLLSCIWVAIDTCGNSDFLQLLIYLLRCISQTYFIQLQKWIYKGELDTAVNEIFITRCINTSPALLDECSKEFFDRGYQVVDDAIPDFLTGCEQDILQCGNYNQVLKAYKAQHPIFDVKYPDLVVCLTEQQLKEMRRNLAERYADIYQQFGWCSMQSIFEERMAAKRNFANIMVKRTQAHLDAWENEQRELLLKANAQKKIMYDKLNAEIEQDHQNRLEKRRQEIVNELAFQRESERLEDMRLELEKQELQKKVSQLAGKSAEKETHEAASPDQSTFSDLSFTSCLEEPDDRADSPSQKDDEKTDKVEEKPAEDEMKQPQTVGSESIASVEPEQSVVVEPELSVPNAVQYQQSHSDVLNSNEPAFKTELDRNRQHILSSDQIQECQTIVHLKQSDSVGVQYLRSHSDVLNSNEPAFKTELDRNRQHIPSSDQIQECQTIVHLKQSDSVKTSTGSGLHAQLPPDINANLNRPETKELSDLQRNRLRSQHHDGFCSFNSTEDEHIQRLRTQVQSDSERARNRRRVLGSEYDIIVGDKVEKRLPRLPLELNKLHVEVPLAALTPMSTTSDVDVFGLSPKEIPEQDDNDAANNNNISVNSEKSYAESPGHELVIFKPVGSSPESLRPTLHLPSRFGMGMELEQETTLPILPEACNPFMARRCLQLSVMAPVNAHYALLRNEVLRIFQELRIYEHFRKLRNYFFLLDGQFGTLLTNDILERIKAGIDPRSICQKGILDTMLTNALAACPADETTVSQNLTLNCTNIPETLSFMSVEATSFLTLDCKVDWPLNLVISSETLVKYAQIFRHLLKLRHVSYVLEGTYEYLQQVGKLLGPELRTAAHFRHLQMVRHKLSHFMTSLQTHLVGKALQATWRSFKEALCNVDSIEGLYKQHAVYLKRVAFLALLNRRSAKVKETIDNILVIVLRFCKVIQSQSFVMDQDNKFVHPRFKRLMQEESEFEKFMQYLIYLGNKAAASGYQEEIGDLICIINFNNYYKVSEDNSRSQTKT
ncbi:gamma-tubulin complex component 6 [Drosophila ficusphila]|uniref:gamma-tubulin complex component 6 n=1 Tax=Drosophila ficusphila TaxID=30025 RepID=UPI0007E65DEF|nr:gamma-tubulin complex component 6 [Drosophila ficusphila]